MMAMIMKQTETTVGAKSNNGWPERTQIPTARDLYFAARQLSPDQQENSERECFSALKLKNGTYKYTYSRRLEDLNDLVQPLLPSARPLQMMDVAVSSGVSTLEWMDSLE